MTYGLSGVSVDVDGQPGLRGVTFDVSAGDVTAVIGADGAGKTTAARLLAGLVGAEEGAVRNPPKAEIGYQPEAAGTWPDLTVVENLRFVARSRRQGRQAGDRIEELLEATRLSDAAGRLAMHLSGGMRQKLAVAMAMIARPSMLVLDEPTTGLDPVSRIELWGLMFRAASEQTAVMVTTSYLNEADRASRAVILDEGSVLAQGSAPSIRNGFEGVVTVSDSRPPDAEFVWRRGGTWRQWWPSGEMSGEAEPVAPDLNDIVMVAALKRRIG